RLMLEAMEFAHVPVIVTVRPTWEGGGCDKDDEYRIGLWEAAIEMGVEYIDVELVAWEKNKILRDRISEAAEKNGTKIILTNHSFEGRPKDLEQRIARLRRIKQADVLKIAWKAESILDAVDALRLTAKIRAEDGRPAVAIAMGEEGLVSRLLGKKFGSPFTFAALDRGAESAPGQPTIEELREVYRWEELKADSPVFAVAGWPIGHSKSPALHNAGLDAIAGARGIYVPLAIKPGNFAPILDALRAVPGMDLRGLSVTIPHKEAAFKYVVDKAGKIDDLSWRIGVLNTISFESDSAGTTTVRGFNSDYEGALDALVSAWAGQRQDVAGKRIAVMGAGGAARAVVAGLVASGASVVVYNRTLQKAQTLADDLGDGKVIAAEWPALRSADADAFINCTPLGMFPNVETSPMDDGVQNWSSQTVIFDTVYNPDMTKLLKLAESKGAKIVKGKEMFIRQAAVQFKAFTGKDAPLEVFRQVMEG
ncbi:MAG TPA: type I 3-dehydroquinate dehydratase, partial [Phycisphaerae bacterium]